MNVSKTMAESRGEYLELTVYGTEAYYTHRGPLTKGG